jgi:hypothetical protein
VRIKDDDDDNAYNNDDHDDDGDDDNDDNGIIKQPKNTQGWLAYLKPLRV